MNTDSIQRDEVCRRRKLKYAEGATDISPEFERSEWPATAVTDRRYNLRSSVSICG